MVKKLYKESESWDLHVSLRRIEYLAINSDARFQVLTHDNAEATRLKKFKCLGAIVDKSEIEDTEIRHRIWKGIYFMAISEQYFFLFYHHIVKSIRLQIASFKVDMKNS